MKPNKFTKEDTEKRILDFLKAQELSGCFFSKRISFQLFDM